MDFIPWKTGITVAAARSIRKVVSSVRLTISETNAVRAAGYTY